MWDWVLLGVGLLTAVFWYMTRHYSYWSNNGVYTLPGCLPGVGHMWEVLTVKMAAGYYHCELYKKGAGHAAVGLYSFRTPALLLRDPNLIQTTLISEFSSFHDNTLEVDEGLDPYIGKNPFVLKGQRWKNIRQKLTPAMSPARIKAMFPLMLRVCDEFNEYMNKHLNKEIDAKHTLGLFTVEVVAKCAFALDGQSFSDNPEFYRQGMKMWEESIYNPVLMLLAQFFPIINKILGKGFFPKDVQTFFASIIEQVADLKKKHPEKAPENDVLNYLLSINQKDPDFTLTDVIAQSLTFFTDGFETTSVLSSLFLHELTVNPDIQEQLRKEIKSSSSDGLNYETINSLPLLDRVFQETLRKYSVFSLVRECTQNFVLEAEGNSYPVRKGQQVIIPVHAIHHDEDIYPNPEKFDPDRFLPEKVKERHPMTFLGFGNGPRICIGFRFATCLVKIIAANTLLNYRLVRGTKTPEKLILNPLNILPFPESGIWLQFQKL